MLRAPKSRFRSVAGKKIEKQVRKFAALNANNRRGHGVASGANQQDKPIMDSNSRHISNVLLHENLASSAKNASKTNKIDNVANEAYRRDIVANDGKRSVAVEANRLVNLDSRPIKQNLPRKDTNKTIMPSTKCYSKPMSKEIRQPIASSLKKFSPSSKNIKKRDDSIVVLRSSEDYDPLKAKTRSRNVDNSQSPQFKAMAGLVHKTLDFNASDQYKDDSMEESSLGRIKERRNIEAKGANARDRNFVGVQETKEDAYRSYGPMKKQSGNTRIEDEDVDSGGTQIETRGHRPMHKKRRCMGSNDVGDSKTNDIIAKKKVESLPKHHESLDCHGEDIQPEKLTHRKLKECRQDTMRNEDEELHDVDDNHSPLIADVDSLRVTSQAPIPIDCFAEVPEHVKKQCNYCAKPIDKPIWSGLFKVDGKESISLAGHLSTKSCDKVWKLSRSLMPVVEVTKLSRSTASLKIWETSKPSCDSIGLYFFPNEMRHDEDLDNLVKEVMEDDLVLQTVIDEAEMLIFPSTLLPERYKTFRRKHYLWGVFKPKQDKCTTVAAPVQCRTQEKEKEEQHASIQQDEVEHSVESMHQAAATRGVPGSPDMGFQPEAPEEIQQEAAAVATNPAAVAAEAAALATNAATISAEATENDTNGATIPGHHGQSNSIAGVPSGRIFCFVAGQTPKLEQLIQEMQREGAFVVAIRGEAIGAGPWPGNIASTSSRSRA